MNWFTLSRTAGTLGGTPRGGLRSAGSPAGPHGQDAPYAPSRGHAELALPLSSLPTCYWAEQPSIVENSSPSACGHTQCSKEKASWVCARQEKLEGRGRNLPPSAEGDIQLSWDQETTEPTASGAGQCVLKAGFAGGRPVGQEPSSAGLVGGQGQFTKVRIWAAESSLCFFPRFFFVNSTGAEGRLFWEWADGGVGGRPHYSS